MNTVLKLILSMSFSGGLLILVLFLGKKFVKDRISRQWQYYIWLVAVLRLLLPFGPETNLLGNAYQAVDWAISQEMTRTAPVQQVLPDVAGSLDASGSPDVAGSLDALGSPDVAGSLDASGSVSVPVMEGKDDGGVVDAAEELPSAHPFQDFGAVLTEYVWLVWLGAALGLLIRKVTIYQGFVRYLHAGSAPVSDIAVLDRLSAAAEQAGVKRPVELWVNPLISSPLLIGFFRPCIVLPGTEVGEKDFRYIVLHELTHYRRGDMFYKWLVQVTVCLHWFNPLVHLMSREITKACEFSCDEAVLAKMGGDAQDYGKTLLDAMAAVGKYRESLGAVTLNENKQLLKERLGAIMNYRKKSKVMWFLTGALTLCVIFGAVFLGVSPIAAASGQPSGGKSMSGTGTEYGSGVGAGNGSSAQMVSGDVIEDGSGAGDEGENGIGNGTGSGDKNGAGNGTGSGDKNGAGNGTGGGDENGAGNGTGNEIGDGSPARAGTGADDKDYDSQAERYYEAGSLPLFQIAFSRLDEEAQDKWLDRIYADDQIGFWGTAVNLLDEDCALIQRYADKAYRDDNISYFSVLAMHMSEDAQDKWLSKALEDEKWSFQSMLFNALNREDEFDELKESWEKEWEEAQAAEYRAVGVTIDGKDYYYQGQLVDIFLDIRPGKAFYTLNMNPAGTVNIKIIRDEGNRITGVAYMTDAEVAELLEDHDEEDDGDGYGDRDDETGHDRDGDAQDDWNDDEDEEDDGDSGWDDDSDDDSNGRQRAAGGRTWYPQVIPVDLETIAEGQVVYLGEYTLSEGDRLWYAVQAETGNGMQVGFTEAGDESLETVYWFVQNRRQEDEDLECIASFTLRPPAKPGTYKLFLRAMDGDLGNVKGSISIGYVADAIAFGADAS